MADNGEREESPRGFSRREISRRDFLRGGAAVGVLGTGLLGTVPSAEPAAAAKAEAGISIVGPGAVPMNFRINGKAMSARLEPRVTLLDALRENLGLTGSKKGCAHGECGKGCASFSRTRRTSRSSARPRTARRPCGFRPSYAPTSC